MIAQNRRTMTYKDGDYYIDIVTREHPSIYESWIYTDASPKFYMFGMPQRQQTYFEFFEIVSANLDEYKYMCDADVSFDKSEYTDLDLARDDAWDEVTS